VGPGHPFLTKELDEQGARQRRTLRLIPDWVIQRVKTESTTNTLDRAVGSLRGVRVRAELGYG